jgi:hypothetical protein
MPPPLMPVSASSKKRGSNSSKNNKGAEKFLSPLITNPTTTPRLTLCPIHYYYNC